MKNRQKGDKADRYLELNRISWDQRLASHLDSDFYNVEAFIQGQNSLKEIELRLLGDLAGKRLLHLQCHFGQDTLSLERLGAECVGVDLSGEAIKAAQKLAGKCGLNSGFIATDVYSLPSHLNNFDSVFTSYGAIGWLPDLNRWATVIAGALKKGGELVFVEFHPCVWMFDDQFEKIAYTYHNSGPIIETETGTYADQSAEIQSEVVCWNHSLGEVISALVGAGLELEYFSEYNYSPYNCFQNMEEYERGRFRIKGIGDKLPMVYSLKARKK